MVSKLIEYQAIANFILLLNTIIIMVSAFIAIILLLIKRYWSDRSDHYQKLIEDVDEEYRKKRATIHGENTLNEQQREEKMKLQEKKSECDDKENNFWNAIPIVLILFIIIIVLWQIAYQSINHQLGGSFSEIYEVVDVEKDGLTIEACYLITYHSFDQKCLTVFVKNNSDRVINSATIHEISTDSYEEVKAIEPGQEKFLTIDIYPNKEQTSEFEIINVEFAE